MKSVVLLSGGMDSATALALALKQGEVIALSIRYGSLHQDAEGQAAGDLCEYYGIKHLRQQLPQSIFEGASSALLGQSAMPDGEYHDPEKESPSATVVPFRNANFISVATSVAESQGASKVWLAAHSADWGGAAYPDCSPEFLGAMAAAVYLGTLRKVQLVYPFIWGDKAEIVRIAAQLEVPLGLTWSCYRGGDVHCGNCPTCNERIKAFKDAGYIDPVLYETERFDLSWNGCVPFPNGTREV